MPGKPKPQAPLKPWLFLDIDGVVNLSKDGSKGKPKKFAARVDAEVDGRPFVYDEDVVGRLQRLLPAFRMVWASAGWRGQEDEYLSPLLKMPAGLPELPLPETYAEKRKGKMPPEKLAAIAEFGGDGPYAIVDDKVGSYVKNWAIGKAVCVIRTNPRRGLVDGDVDQLLEFASEIAAAG